MQKLQQQRQRSAQVDWNSAAAWKVENLRHISRLKNLPVFSMKSRLKSATFRHDTCLIISWKKSEKKNECQNSQNITLGLVSRMMISNQIISEVTVLKHSKSHWHSVLKAEKIYFWDFFLVFGVWDTWIGIMDEGIERIIFFLGQGFPNMVTVIKLVVFLFVLG